MENTDCVQHGLASLVMLMASNILHDFLAVSMALAIPTIKRQRESYLFQTLESLIDGLNAEEKNDAVIIVFIGEVSRLVLHMAFNSGATLYIYPWFKHILFTEYIHEDIDIQQKGLHMAMMQCGPLQHRLDNTGHKIIFFYY